jgi:FtsP/CotA-like multicopper oxidase with cupredoxin domain
MSRRKFLGLGAGTLAALGLGSSAHSTPTGSYFYEPPVRSSANGFLTTTLRAALTPTIIENGPAVSAVYEGIFPGPTLKIRPGDFLGIELINDFSEPTNLHTHGLHVTPLTPGDNVLIEILPGQRFQYEYTIPKDHPGGTYFYHPHRHGFSANQNFKGQMGFIIIEGDIDEIPGIAGLPERSLALMRTVIGPDGHTIDAVPDRPGNPPDPGPVLVNGSLRPIMFISPGETQRWRLLNGSVSSLWTIQIEGHPMTLIAQDGNTLANAVTLDSLNIATAQRRDVLVQGASRPGVYQVSYQDLQGPFGVPPPPVTMAYLVVTGPAQPPQPLPTKLLPFVDLRNVAVDKQRTIEFQILNPPPPPPDPGNPFETKGFVIDGKFFNPNRVDQFGRLNTTEEWTVKNSSNLTHPFHIHINPYQVIKKNGQPFEALSYEDTTPVPGGGSITFRTRFLDFPGTWVFHCHILGHEDGGMMAILQVS